MSFKHKKPITNCKKCGEIVNIMNTSYVQGLITRIKTQKENYALQSHAMRKLHLCKNGTIQALHKKIGLMLDMMNEDQIEKFKKINKSCDEEVKQWKRKLYNKK